jgi:hypothetical protein
MENQNGEIELGRKRKIPLQVEISEEMQIPEDDSRYATSRDGGERTSREVDQRIRPDDSFFAAPNYDEASFEVVAQMQLVAPPPRVDAKWGLMQQYWANVDMSNGNRVSDMRQNGWVARHPSTLPPLFRGRTSMWHGHEVIMVANNMLLMEMPLTHYRKRLTRKAEESRRLVRGLKETHGRVYRDGEILDSKDSGAGAFEKTEYVSREIDS